MANPTGSVTSSIGGGPVAYWQNGVLVTPGAAPSVPLGSKLAPLTGGVTEAAPMSANVSQTGAVPYSGGAGVTVAPQVTQNSVVNSAQTYAPDVRAETNNYVTKVPTNIPGLPELAPQAMQSLAPMMPMNFADMVQPPAPQGGVYDNVQQVAYNPPPPRVQAPPVRPYTPYTPDPSMPNDTGPVASPTRVKRRAQDVEDQTPRGLMDMLRHPLGGGRPDAGEAARQQEIQRYYQANPQDAAPAQPQQPQQPTGGGSSTPNGITPKDPYDYSQGPPDYPVARSPYAHPGIAAIASALGPRSAALYLGAMNGQQHRNDKVFDAQNQWALERMKQDTELKKAQMTERGKGALSYEQAMNQADKIRAMPDGPQKFHQLIRLEAASMASGLGMSFADIVTDGQDPESAAHTRKVIADAASSQADAFKKVETAATEVAAINRENQMKMSKAEDYYATREGDVQGKMSRDHADVLKDQEQSQTFIDRVAQQHQATLQGGLNLQKTQQEIAANPMMQAEKATAAAAAMANAAAMATGPLKQQLEMAASDYQAQARALMQQQPGRQVQLPTGQSPVQGVDGPLIGRDGKVVMHQNTRNMPIAPAVQGYINQQGVPAPPAAPSLNGPSPQLPTDQHLVAPPPATPGQMAQVPPPPGNGWNPQTAPEPIALPPAPKSGAVLTDPKMINSFLQAAGGDPNRATELAQSQGWKIPAAPSSPKAQQQLQAKVAQQAPATPNPFQSPPAPTLPSPAQPPGKSWQDSLLEWTRGETPEQKETVRLMHANAAMRARAAQVHEVTPQGPSRAPVTAENPRPWNDQGILPHPAQVFPGAVPIAQGHNYPGGEPVEPGRHIRQVQNLLAPIPGHIMDGTTGRALGEMAQSAAHRYGIDQAIEHAMQPPLKYYPGAEPIAQHNFPGGQSLEEVRRQSIEKQLRDRAFAGDKKALSHYNKLLIASGRAPVDPRH